MDANPDRPWHDRTACAYSEAIRPPYLSLARDGKPVVPESYTGAVDVQDRYVPDAVLPDRVLGHFRAGATITWSALNHHRPNLRRPTAGVRRPGPVVGGRGSGWPRWPASVPSPGSGSWKLY